MGYIFPVIGLILVKYFYLAEVPSGKLGEQTTLSKEAMAR
uniref:Uncharacterized protein n=1 Tax=Anguilla anguilla TaxID=7936 RepID=A0A0E9R604_ANGAN